MPMVPDNGPYPWEQKPSLSLRETQYLVFREVAAIGSTRRWNVESKRTGVVLARIGWYGPWRQFVMRPAPDTIFNKGCLTDINTFIDDAMADWRESKRVSA